MIKLNAIPLDYKPRHKVMLKLSPYGSNLELFVLMNEVESAFLCGMIEQFSPKKIVEVGVAGGGTTAIILQALEDLGESYEMHSIDAAPTFYRDKTKPAGFMAAFALENNLFAPPHSTLSGTHEFHLGKFLPQVIDDIGNEIDFVILDTMHIMPGEGLDFLAVLPYLKPEAVVVMHDVSMNQNKQSPSAHATTVLFSAVTADKFLNFLPGDVGSKYVYPNIAAFQINGQTAVYAENIFLTMILRWTYLPSRDEINLYRAHYRRHYPQELCKIFDEAIKMNVYNMVIDAYI